MYCTISLGAASTGLDDDARFAYSRFRRKARALGSISSSFDELTLAVTVAYFAALTAPAPETWTTLVKRTDALVSHTRALGDLVALGAAEIDSLDFFAAIVRENSDLLSVPEALSRRSDLVPLTTRVSR